MMNHQQWCRILLALWFLLAVLAGIGFLLYPPMPVGRSEEPVTLSPAILPFWLSTLLLAYLAGSALLLLSHRIERATMRGFRLWDLPRD